MESQDIIDPNVVIEIDESVPPFMSSPSSVASEPHGNDLDATMLTQPILSFVPADAAAFPGPYVPAAPIIPQNNIQGIGQNDAQTGPLPVLPPVSQHGDSTITQPGMQSVVASSVEPAPTTTATRLAGIENLSPEAQAHLVTSIADDIQAPIVTICRHLRDGTLSRGQVTSLDKVIKWVKGKDRKVRKRLESRAGKLERQYGSLVGNLADIVRQAPSRAL
ncbi:hypothetical protein N7493_002332 [Penicillium malachiteum]|uniref:Uncharacterized protein n=1 Tax=Penicillium malachiteum TaxID=1324776 RepID=A0AAD6HRN1_9EURO|nr:hypothetical protein N7493_002332 [Penicillium malachiteum]